MNNTVSIGIDIGGTKISAVAIKNNEIISDVLSFKTAYNLDNILKTVLEAVEVLKKDLDAKVVGIATAGAVNLENSRVIGSTGNLPQGYNKLDFKKIIEEKYGLTVFIENDANAAAYAEFKAGNAKNQNNNIVITLGTGIGGGIIINGKLLRGKSGSAAEVGHIPISLNSKRVCSCGALNCWEAYASGTGYAKNAREMAEEIPPDERTGILQDKDISKLTTYDIIEGLKISDPFAIKVHTRWENLVLMGLIALANIFDPDSIVLSGGMAKFADFEKLGKLLNQHLVVPEVKLLPAKMGNYAGMIGAAILATEQYIYGTNKTNI